jgi:hypothetical protein
MENLMRAIMSNAKNAASILVVMLCMVTLAPSLIADTWARRAGTSGSNSFNEPIATATDSKGNMYSLGLFTGTLNLPGGSVPSITSSSTNFFDHYLIKYNASGVPQWSRRITRGGNSYPSIFGSGRSGIVVDSIGDIYVLGSFDGTMSFDGGSIPSLTSIGSEDIFLVKYNDTGVPQWAQRSGSVGANFPSGVCIGSNNTILIAANSYQTDDVTFSGGLPDLNLNNQSTLYVVAYNTIGVPQWSRIAVESSSNIMGLNMTADASGNSYLTGFFSGDATPVGGGSLTPLTSIGQNDIFVIKHNNSGVPQWINRAGGNDNSGTSYERGYSIITDASGNVFVSGAFQETATFSGGSIGTIVSDGPCDALLIKYNSTGSVQWARRMGGSSYDEALDVNTDNGGTIYVVGHFRATASFPGGSISNKVSNGAYDGFLARYNQSGVPQDVVTIGSPEEDLVPGLAVGTSADVYVLGKAGASAITFPNIGAVSGGNMFLWKLCYGTSSTPASSATTIPSVTCPGDSTTLSMNGGLLGTGAKWVWYASACGGTPIGKGTSIRVAPRTTTTYFIRAESMCDTSTCISTIVTVNPNPNGAITGEVKPCNGQQYTYTIPSAVPRSYQWLAGQSATIIATNNNQISIVWHSDGATSISDTLRIREINTVTGCFHDTLLAVTINPLPRPMITGDTVVCAGSVRTYRAQQVAGNTYQWSIITGDATLLSSSVIDSVVVQLNNSTQSTEIVKLQLRQTISTTGCSKDTFILVSVNPVPRANAGVDETICLYERATVGNTATGGTGTLQYSWSPTEGIIGTNTSSRITAMPSRTTAYTVTVTDEKGCIGIDTVVVRINTPPDLIIGTDVTICKGDTINIGGIAIGLGDIIYDWQPTQGLNNSRIARPFASPDTTTKYRVIATDEVGCKDTAFVTVRVRIQSMSVMPASTDIGVLSSCQQSRDTVIILSNTGEDDVILRSYNAPAGFTVLTSLPDTLSKGEQLTLRLRFAPSIAGIVSGKLSLNTEPCKTVFESNIQGTKLELLYSADRAVVDFGTSVGCRTDIEQDSIITLRNNGSEALTMNTPDVIAPFSIVSPNVFPVIIQPKGELRFTVRYKPTAVGQYTTDLRLPFVSGACSSEIKVKLTAWHKLPELKISPANTVFNTMRGCDPSRDTVVTVTNTNTIDLDITTIQSSDPQFAVVTSLPVTVRAGQTSNIKIRFAPTKNGVQTGTLSFNTLPCNIIATIGVEGRKDGVTFDLPDTVDVGMITLCSQKNIRKTVAIKNTSGGGIDGSVKSILLNSFITTTLATGDQLLNNIERPFDIVFEPSASVPFDTIYGAVDIVLNPCDVSKRIIVRAINANVELTPIQSLTDYGTVSNGQTRTRIVSFVNTGLAGITVDSIEGIASPFILRNTVPQLPARLSLGDTLFAQIDFVAENGVFERDITARISLPCTVSTKAKLRAEGSDRAIYDIDVPNQANFDSTCVSVRKTITITLRNIGNQPLNLLRAEWINNPSDVFRAVVTPRIIPVGGSTEQEIEFTPTSAITYTGEIRWITDGDSSASTTLIGTGRECRLTTATIRNVNARQGEPVSLDFHLEGEPPLGWQSLPTRFSARIGYNRTVLHATNPNLSCNDPSSDECLLDIQGERSNDSVLAVITCIATLGNTDMSPLRVLSFRWLDIPTQDTIQTRDGVFQLTDVCDEGGVRLYTPGKTKLSLSTRPNPASSELRIEYSLIEPSIVTLELTDNTGTVVSTFLSDAQVAKGMYQRRENVSSLANGIYFLRLRTQNYVLASIVVIAR